MKNGSKQVFFLTLSIFCHLLPHYNTIWVSQNVDSPSLTRKGYMGVAGTLPNGVTAIVPNQLQSLGNSLMTLTLDRTDYLVTLQPGVYRITVIFKLDSSASGNTSLLSGGVGIEVFNGATINSIIVKSDTYKGHIESTIDIIQNLETAIAYKFFIQPTGASNLVVLQGSSIFISEMSRSEPIP